MRSDQPGDVRRIGRDPDGVTLQLPAVVVDSGAVLQVWLSATLAGPHAEAVVMSGWEGGPC